MKLTMNKNNLIHLDQFPDISFMELMRKDGSTYYTIFDRQFEEKILKYKWNYNSHKGYVMGRCPEQKD